MRGGAQQRGRRQHQQQQGSRGEDGASGKMAMLKDRRIRVKSEEGTYCGLFVSLDQDRRQIKLRDVYDYHNEAYLPVPLTVSDYTDLEVLAEKKEGRRSDISSAANDSDRSEHNVSDSSLSSVESPPRPFMPVPEEHRGSGLYRNAKGKFIKADPQPAHLLQMADPQCVPSLYQTLETLPSDPVDDSWLGARNAKLVTNPLKCIYALSEIEQQESVVGLGVHGNLWDAPGRPSLVTLVTGRGVTVIDVVSCARGSETGDYLRQVLESDTILKVCMESGILAEVLRANYGIQLANVFDLQVVDGYIACGPETSYTPQLYAPLQFLRRHYLGQSACPPPAAPDYCIKAQRDRDVWLKRPLHSFLLDKAISDTADHLSLYHALNRRLAAKPARLCAIRLAQFRGSCQSEFMPNTPVHGVQYRDIADPRELTRPDRHLEQRAGQSFSRAIRHAPREEEVARSEERKKREEDRRRREMVNPARDIMRQKWEMRRYLERIIQSD